MRRVNQERIAGEFKCETLNAQRKVNVGSLVNLRTAALRPSSKSIRSREESSCEILTKKKTSEGPPENFHVSLPRLEKLERRLSPHRNCRNQLT
jgi:hypothetical protein